MSVQDLILGALDGTEADEVVGNLLQMVRHVYQPIIENLLFVADNDVSRFCFEIFANSFFCSFTEFCAQETNLRGGPDDDPVAVLVAAGGRQHLQRRRRRRLSAPGRRRRESRPPRHALAVRHRQGGPRFSFVFFGPYKERKKKGLLVSRFFSGEQRIGDAAQRQRPGLSAPRNRVLEDAQYATEPAQVTFV